ncbi:substrate-binding domain-containing protein [Paenibacillus herberti]|uniref:GntR family transcriptional regulator n=1 Tax=Paenibacillus herberti TaxID=1619309 RepID=A0A229P500_9BACL|nr:GntR family transcriptional regulator [Paenibacillus herberti]OXM17131.1 GntR family transcriptional regulator [Paenibacillus herberti]
MSSKDRMPLYQEIQEFIRELIASEGLAEGNRIPTDQQLMDKFNVSKITVVNALKGLAGEGLITRVPGRGSFVSGAARAVEATTVAGSRQAAAFTNRSTGYSVQTGLIGMVIPSIGDYFATRLVEGARKAIEAKGRRLAVLFSGGKLEQEKEAIVTLQAVGAEGLLIFPVDEEQYNEEILAMKVAGFPFVLLDRYLPGVETNYIAADGRKGMELAVDHLWELGHREIAICSDSPLQTVTVQERIEGYMNALKQKGALINPAHIMTGFSVDNLEDTESHPLHSMMRSGAVSAYITLNGHLAVRMCQLAQKAGLRVPEDLSIVSFDDPTSIVEEMSHFTHIRQFEFEMGLQAGERLHDMIESGGKDTGNVKIILQPELAIRQTSGPPS